MPNRTRCLIKNLIPVLLLVASTLFPGSSGAHVITSLNVKGIALTFDACETITPSHFDEKILSYLVREQIPFTVFMTGRFAKRNSKRLKEISKLPFVEIENHSFNHEQHMERMSPDEVRKEVSSLDDLIKKMIGKKTKYFRFPGGNYDSKTLKLVEDMNYKVVHWTFASGDPDKHVTAPKLKNWVVYKAKQGNVLIFHINGRGYSTGEALPQIITELRRKGYKFVKLEDGGI
jgi:peptidoglycan/xylan/chitin deacetylase (PgdA/CDA1 family)